MSWCKTMVSRGLHKAFVSGIVIKNNSIISSPRMLTCSYIISPRQARFASYSADGNENKKMEMKIKENIQKLKEGQFDEVRNPEDLTHFKKSQSIKTDEREALETRKIDDIPPMGIHALPHPIWSEDELTSVKVTHKQPTNLLDKVAYYAIQVIRFGFDTLSGYNWKKRNESVWLNRICFLETVAGVPGMVAAMVRHLQSLRRMRRDHGWIHTLLEEAENERMHLMTALQLKQPSWFFRTSVILTQGLFVTGFSFAYLVSPRFCHRLVGYLEEEAVVTYTKLLQDIETGEMQHWKTAPAPEVAIRYWKLSEDAVMREVILAIRADEAHHRIVNHTLGSMDKDEFNPYKPGE